MFRHPRNAEEKGPEFRFTQAEREGGKTITVEFRSDSCRRRREGEEGNKSFFPRSLPSHLRGGSFSVVILRGGSVFSTDVPLDRNRSSEKKTGGGHFAQVLLGKREKAKNLRLPPPPPLSLPPSFISWHVGRGRRGEKEEKEVEFI